MPPSVLIIHNRYTVQGGEEKIVEQQIALLKSKGHSVYTYFEDSTMFASQNIFGKVTRAVQMPFSVRHFLRLREVVRSFRPKIIHVHNVFPLLTPSVYYAAQHEKIPIVQSVHNYRFMCSNGLFLLPSGQSCERCVHGSHWNAVRFGCYSGSRIRSAGMALSLSLHRWMNTYAKTIDAFIAPSLFINKKLVEGGFPGEKIHRMTPGLLPLADRSREPVDHVALFIGRLSREKGLHTLLKAAQLLPGVTVQIVGDGPLREELQTSIKQLGLRNVQMLGRLPTSEIEVLLQKATALVLPSECYENLPTVILEAWFYGLPVIASRLGGMAELVEDDKTGFLFTAGAARELADRIRDVDLNKSRSMRNSIEKYFHDHFSVEANYKNLMDVYRKVIFP